MSSNERVDLTSFNTFQVPASANNLIVLDSHTDLSVLGRYKDEEKLILGGGSNLLFVEPLSYDVIMSNRKGIRYHNETKNSVIVTVESGENWHSFVMKTISDGYSGLENLALIPGKVGAAPVQNIGAYGVELKDRLVSLTVYDFESGVVKEFSNIECGFDYRDSIFKRERDRYLIMSISCRLDKSFNPVLDYSPLKKSFNNSSAISPLDVANQVINIRQSKLPDPGELGNGGSFFKNPIVSNEVFEEIRKEYSNIIGFPAKSGTKIAAGWLIDNLGLKGFKKGNAGIYEKQALVLVNLGNATGKEIFELSEFVIEKVKYAYGLTLEREVRVLTNSSINS
ncbi:UDP-N-acetylmuramate dehydrogenase [Pleionea sediminis]|uniref:UDP-N-acetylmuramate dehydrogenase n=1 Tax=Pleionea sediminis TaxID=2569479 RepID=UPI0013DE6420|nr:UDP-N-acetylmuramate dehydrogenase [Pleionea sediminis]